MKTQSFSRFTEESMATFIGDPEDQNMVMLEKGDTIKYRKYGKTMEAFFVAGESNGEKVKIRKTRETYDIISLQNIVEKTGSDNQ